MRNTEDEYWNEQFQEQKLRALDMQQERNEIQDTGEKLKDLFEAIRPEYISDFDYLESQGKFQTKAH